MSLLIDAETAEVRLSRAEPLYRRMGKGNSRDRSTYVSGRSAHSTETPEFLRELIAADAIKNGNMSATGREWGVGMTAVHSYVNGKTSPAGEALQERSEKVHALAAAHEADTAMILAEKLLSAVNAIHVTEDDGALKNSVIARNLAGTLEKIKPKKDSFGNGNVINFNVFTPAKVDLASLGEPITVIETTAKNVSKR